jgi:hypothetical protein
MVKLDYTFAEPRVAADFSSALAEIGYVGVQNFKRQMLRDSFPHNKDGTRRYASGTRLINSFRFQAGSHSLVWTAGEGLPYARVQFLGGRTHPSVMAKSRRFFWQMFFRTGEDKWKWMALSKKPRFTVIIRPANPFYLSDALVKLIKRKLAGHVFKITGNLRTTTYTGYP